MANASVVVTFHSFNTSILDDNATHVNESTHKKYFGVIVLQNLITAIGLLANIITAITLVLNGKEFPRLTRILFIQQALLDSLVCLLAIILYSQRFMWMTGNATFDLLLCQVWHGQGIYWIVFQLSIWNLMLIAIERFLKIDRPFTHLNMRPNHIYLVLIVMLFFNIIVYIPAYLQTKYDEETGECYGKYYFDTKSFAYFMSFIGLLYFGLLYAFPAASFIVIYTKIVITLRRRHKLIKNMCQPSRIVDNAEQQLTRTAIAVTVVFILSLSWDLWCYLLARFGVMHYEKDTWQSIVGVFLATFNSCANPFIYLGALPIFRQSLEYTFKCTLQRKQFQIVQMGSSRYSNQSRQETGSVRKAI